MKKLLLMFMIAGFASTATMAQEPAKDQKATHAEWEKKLKDELKLTPDQTVKFDALSQEYRTKIETLEKDATLDAATQKEKKIALKKEKETKLFEFLTPEQQTKYKALIEEKKAAMKPAGSQ